MTAEPIRVCVVCLGNICRSPMAEAVLRHKVARAGMADAVVVESGGTGGWHVGGPADPRALETLSDAGYDASAHLARQFTADWFERFDLVLALDRDTFATLNRLAPDEEAASTLQMLRAYDSEALAAGELDVPDPFYGVKAGFELALHQVERASDGLVTTLQDELVG